LNSIFVQSGPAGLDVKFAAPRILLQDKLLDVVRQFLAQKRNDQQQDIIYAPGDRAAR
jgi:hypothetical protein